MIPKIIHYCWFGGKPLPALAIKCIASWKKFHPDYEIKRWDESNFDVNAIPYTRDAYIKGKFAFVSDYARFFILYQRGGIYLDTDVELIRPLNDILAVGPFMGDEMPGRCAPGLGMGTYPKMTFLKEMIDFYHSLSFIKEDGSLNCNTIVTYTTSALMKYGYKKVDAVQQIAGFTIYPAEYFCPINYFTKERLITLNTYSIHHYAESWVSTRMRYYELCNKVLGIENTKRIASFLKKINAICRLKFQ